MKNITEHIQNRRSVRTFDGREIDKTDIERLASFTQTIENPFEIPVSFKFMNAKEHGLNCPVTVGTDMFVGGKIKCTENASVAFGYAVPSPSPRRNILAYPVEPYKSHCPCVCPFHTSMIY